jgi:hypothetical protein
MKRTGASLPGARPPIRDVENRNAWLIGGEMLSKCSNPDCQAPFDYREGRLVRHSRTLPGGRPGEIQRVIKHFWLCGKCAALYLLEYESGMNIKLKLRDRILTEEDLPLLISAA